LISIFNYKFYYKNKVYFYNFKFIYDFFYLSNKNYFISIMICSILFSFSGIPPFAGFFSKFLLIFNFIDSSYYFFSIYLIILSIISSYYYLIIIKNIFFIKFKNNINQI